MKPVSNKTISEIVRANYRTADVFRKHGINYCCGGQSDLHTICTVKGLDYEGLSSELEAASREVRLSSLISFTEWKPDFLIDYILHVHHAYLIKAIPPLMIQVDAFVEGHKKKQQEWMPIRDNFSQIADRLMKEMQLEETVIFPYIRQLYTAYTRKESYGKLFVRTLRKPLGLAGDEHARLPSLFNELDTLTGGFCFPENACTNQQVLMHKLRELSQDFSQHSYLEHTVLFPGALHIEQQLLQS
ncbi:MAG TPA: DUF542 domain-containing protein [Flavisolibacter sp.]|nr:DUF542 domain-containing protein [Flavisolibacter sp.]